MNTLYLFQKGSITMTSPHPPSRLLWYKCHFLSEDFTNLQIISRKSAGLPTFDNQKTVPRTHFKSLFAFLVFLRLLDRIEAKTKSASF